MTIKRMTDLSLKGQRVLIREDLNVPLKKGRITSDARIRAALPTIKQALDAGARVIITSHLGRPTEGEFDSALSLQPVADKLSCMLGCEVPLVSDWLDGVTVEPGQAVLCENVRFNVGEKANDAVLSQKMAALCDIFVMDAFGTAHRAQASTHGVAQYAPAACAGPLLAAELDALTQALREPARPLVAVVGGSKVSTKLEVLDALADKVDQLIVGGGIANTFLAAKGFPVGKSLYEPGLLDAARKIMDKVNVPIPVDVIVAEEFSETAEATLKNVADVADNEMILDIGPKTAHVLAALMKEAQTIIWNGPVGVFEFEQFSHGTAELSQAIAESEAFSIAGGGDTLAAIDKFDITDQVSYISTGGGAFLEFVEGKQLPAVAMLEQRS